MQAQTRRPTEHVSSCVACGATFDSRAYSLLPAVDRLYAHQLRDVISEWPWPLGACLEVRACRCGATVARLSR